MLFHAPTLRRRARPPAGPWALARSICLLAVAMGGLVLASTAAAVSFTAEPRRRSRSLSGDILYDQYNNPGTNGTSSQNFEASFNQYDTELADDFVVPAGPDWSVDGVDVDGVYFNGPGPATTFNVSFYQDAAGFRECSSRPARTRRTPGPQAML